MAHQHDGARHSVHRSARRQPLSGGRWGNGDNALLARPRRRRLPRVAQRRRGRPRREGPSRFIEAGADIVLTNTFGGNRLRLDLHKLGDRVAELNQAGVAVARRAADLADRPVAIAGSVGPTGELFEPLGTLSHQRGVEVFTEQCEALADAGADVIWIETISSFEELNAAVEAASGTGLPIAATLSFDTAGHTMMGIHPRDFGRWWLGHQRSPPSEPTAASAPETPSRRLMPSARWRRMR